MKIIRATLAHLGLVSNLFNSYRVFYKQAPSILAAEKFIHQRLLRKDSIIFLAMDEKEKEAFGFAQIYPTFSSVRVTNIYTLNDLFVVPEHRKKGVAKALLARTKQEALQNGIGEVVLETAADNMQARKLYESVGYKHTATGEYLTYKLALAAAEEKAPDLAQIVREEKPKGIVLITGVTSGLGRVMVGRFHEAGWLVAGCGRSEKEINKLRQQFGGAHCFDVVDIADPYAVRSWSERVIKLCGVPDLLINNASIINKLAKTEEIPTDEFAAVMDINVMGSVNIVQAFLSAMKERGKGIIINMSSGWGRTAEKELAPYCASKFAIEGFTKALAGELPAGMAAVALDPRDGIATPMLSICCPADYVKTAPTPDDWSRVAVPFMLGITSAQNGESLTCPPVAKPAPELDSKKKESTPSSSHPFWLKPAIGGVIFAAGAAAAVIGLSKKH